MKAIIIEDEKAAVRNPTSLLGEVCPQIEIVTELDSIADTIEWFTDHSMPDLVFMDIHPWQMGRHLRSLNTSTSPAPSFSLLPMTNMPYGLSKSTASIIY